MDNKSVKINIYASSNNWIEGSALNQFNNIAEKADVCHAVALPDLHPGRGVPVGSVFMTTSIIYPSLIGNDIGCGIGLWQMNLPVRKLKLDKVVKKLEASTLNKAGQFMENTDEGDDFASSLGTIGGGNHFAELTKVKKVVDEVTFNESSLDKSKVFLLVHSGSRGKGQQILNSYVSKFRDQGVCADSKDGVDYLKSHDEAVEWGKLNRRLIAESFCSVLGTEGAKVCDVRHNCLERKTEGWLHRKGAAVADEGLVVIAGSRGTHSYIVKPINQSIDNLWSVSHGAGRKWARHEVKPRLYKKYTAKDMLKTELGSRVICSDKELLYEEAPQAYKNIEMVIRDLEDAQLIKVVAVLKPVVTYKTNRERKR